MAEKEMLRFLNCSNSDEFSALMESVKHEELEEENYISSSIAANLEESWDENDADIHDENYISSSLGERLFESWRSQSPDDNLWDSDEDIVSFTV